MFGILAKFFRFSGRENGNKFKLSIVIGLIEALASAMKIPAIMYILIGLLSGKPTGKYIGGSVAIMVLAIVVDVICKRYSTVLQTEGGYNASAFMRIKIAEHLRYLPMGYFNSNSIGEISSITTNTMEILGDVAARVVMLTMQGILETSMIILMLFIFDWRIGLIAAAGVLIFFGVNSVMQNAGKKDSEQKVICDTELVNQIMEYLQGISEVKSYNLLGKQAKRLNDANEACEKINTKMELLFVPYHFLQSVITKITGAVIVACSAYFYINGTMSAVYAIGMTISAFMLYSSLECAGNYSSLLHVVSVCVDKANAILELDTMDIDGREIQPENYDIRLSGVSFSYDKRKIIDNVSLAIPQKTTTAIVGPSGGGKSTLCNLIARFWDVDSGEVTLGGENVKDYSMNSLMRNFSFVFQSVYLFADTIENNIKFGRQDASHEDVVEAEQVSLCDTVHVFISKLGIEVSSKVTETQYDCLLERYDGITLSNSTVSSRNSSLTTALSSIRNTANEAYNTALRVETSMGEQIGGISVSMVYDGTLLAGLFGLHYQNVTEVNGETVRYNSPLCTMSRTDLYSLICCLTSLSSSSDIFVTSSS